MPSLVRVKGRGGQGGSGAISFRREKFVPRGGPDGGDGGRGGSVFVEAARRAETLAELRGRRTFEAESGGDGRGGRRHGRKGQDVVLVVPLGTVVRRVTAAGVEKIADLVVEGQRVLVAEGGRGGLGNAAFATPGHQTPRHALLGESGREYQLELEFVPLADVALLGFPNTGKSSLLRCLTSARTQVAAYPCSTVEPVMGVLEVEHEQITLVDLPPLRREGSGVYRSAARALRPAQRATVLLLVLDGGEDDLLARYSELRQLIEACDSVLGTKKELVVVNKADVEGAGERAEGLGAALAARGVAVRIVSVLTGEGLDDLSADLVRLVVENRARPQREAAKSGEVALHLPLKQGRFSVEREGAVVVVRGERAERVAARADLSSEQGRQAMVRFLRRLGVVKAVEQAGVKPGEVVRIGDVEITW